MLDVALVTCAALVGLAPDDRRLLTALRKRGVSTEPVVWEDPYHDWHDTSVAVIRSAWDYAFRREAFLRWVDAAGTATQLWNPPQVVHWNTHKRYLVDLAARGATAVPTALLPAGSGRRLHEVLREHGWQDAVVKPAVAQSGRYALRVSRTAAGRGQALLDRVLPHEDMLIQPFFPSVGTAGELSLVWIDGAFTHAVRKRAAAGEFRVHDDHGGSVALDEPTDDEMRAARRALETVAEPVLYARVDLVKSDDDEPHVMELELVEPELFLRCSDAAVTRLADAIVNRLG